MHTQRATAVVTTTNVFFMLIFLWQVAHESVKRVNVRVPVENSTFEFACSSSNRRILHLNDLLVIVHMKFQRLDADRPVRVGTIGGDSHTDQIFSQGGLLGLDGKDKPSGIFYVDLETGESKLIISLADIARPGGLARRNDHFPD